MSQSPKMAAEVRVRPGSVPVIAVQPFAPSVEAALLELRQDSVDALEAATDAQAAEWTTQASGCVVVLSFAKESELGRFVEWTKRLKARIQQRQVRFVLISKFDAEEALNVLIGSGGFAEILREPVTDKTLRHKIENHLRALKPRAAQKSPARMKPSEDVDLDIIKRLIQDEVALPIAATAGAEGSALASTLSPLALGFLISELISKRGVAVAAQELVSRACGYLSGACEGARVELWKRTSSGGWIYAGGACDGAADPLGGRCGPQVNALDGAGAGVGYEGAEGERKFCVAPIAGNSGVQGAIVIEAQGATVPLEFARACGTFFVGLLLY